MHAVPIVQLFFSRSERDGGVNGDPVNTGYMRLIVAPGVEIDRDP